MDLQRREYCHLLCNFSFKYQSSMTIFHYTDVRMYNVSRFVSNFGWISSKCRSSMTFKFLHKCLEKRLPRWHKTPNDTRCDIQCPISHPSMLKNLPLTRQDTRLKAISHTRLKARDREHCIVRSLIGRKMLRPSELTSHSKVKAWLRT